MGLHLMDTWSSRVCMVMEALTHRLSYPHGYVNRWLVDGQKEFMMPCTKGALQACFHAPKL